MDKAPGVWEDETMGAFVLPLIRDVVDIESLILAD